MNTKRWMLEKKYASQFQDGERAIIAKGNKIAGIKART